MDVIRITEERDWDALADIGRAPLAQRWLYGAIAERLGRKVTRLAVYEADEKASTCASRPAAFAQIISRKIAGIDVALTTRGPIFLGEDNKLDVLKALRAKGPKAAVTLITPDEHLRRLRLSSQTRICDLDIDAPTDDIRARFHGKWRNGLRKAEKSGLVAREIAVTRDALMPLLRAEKLRQDEGRYRGLPPEFILAIQTVAPRSLRLFGAADAQMLFIQHGNTATYQIGNAGPQGRAQNAHNLLLWTAIKALKSDGVVQLDLGMIDTKRAPDLTRFKLRTGALPRQIAAAQLL